jgi:hypothetical protein
MLEYTTAASKETMAPEYKINSLDLEEYFATLARCSETAMDDDTKLRELMRSYAELKFRVMGGGHCAVCRSHVRHVFPVIAEQSSGEVKELDCLCTRCFESEKSTAVRMVLVVGLNRVKVKLGRHESESMRPRTAKAARSSRAQ